MAAISIVVPVYNARDCLAACLESIRRQSLTDYECILVDDGSTDGSAAILDAFSAEDARFLVLHQKNAGVGAARNAGLQRVRGTFLTFIDSDDTIAPSYLEDLRRGIGNQDVLISGFTMCSPEGRNTIGSVAGGPSTDHMAMAMKQGLLNSCWGKLYRREAVQEFRFSEKILWGEDTAYLLSCLCKTNQVVFHPSWGYLYTYSTNGLANRFDRMKPYYLGVYYEQLVFFLDRWAAAGDPLYNEGSVKISQEILRTVDALIDHRLPAKEEKAYLRTLFGNPQVNRLFSYGARLDNNPAVLKLLSRLPNQMVWSGYVRARRYILRGKT